MRAKLRKHFSYYFPGDDSTYLAMPGSDSFGDFYDVKRHDGATLPNVFLGRVYDKGRTKHRYSWPFTDWDGSAKRMCGTSLKQAVTDLREQFSKVSP